MTTVKWCKAGIYQNDSSPNPKDRHVENYTMTKKKPNHTQKTQNKPKNPIADRNSKFPNPQLCVQYTSYTVLNSSRNFYKEAQKMIAFWFFSPVKEEMSLDAAPQQKTPDP